MGNENQSMAMLTTYGQDRVKYIAVFKSYRYLKHLAVRQLTLYVQQDFGDEGKWVWMARISGQAKG